MCHIIGLAYPAYASARTLEEPTSLERTARLAYWLRYWSVLACVSTAEAAAGQRFPGYYHAKLLLLLWLQSRRYQGAARLYCLLLRPALDKLRPSTEAFLARASAFAERPHTAAVAWSLHSLLASIPVVEWFVRFQPSEDSDPASAATRRRRNLLS
ncbi:hypothetical protein WJX81_006683 [Elliptochloris bilobata]|uniref:HVA22-like protein n=1 Tax=Elliptochloris bilobata TaxID=381761 RepID=A0AAW1RT87_9CHLO